MNMRRRWRIGVEGGLLLLLIGLSIVTGQEREWLYILPAALLHEGGHYLAALTCGAKVKGLRMDLLGARMEVDGLLSYGKELFIAAGGPLVNFVTAALAYLLVSRGLLPDGEGAALFIWASVGLGVLNLLPVGTMDGGRILSAALSGLFSPRAARRCLDVTTMLCLGALWCLAAYALLRGAPLASTFAFTLALLVRYAAPDGNKREI